MQLTTLFTVVLLVAGTALAAPVPPKANNKGKLNFGAIKVAKPAGPVKMARSIEKREPEPILKLGGADLLPSLRQPPGGAAADTGKAGIKSDKKVKRSPNKHKKPAEKPAKNTGFFTLLGFKNKKYFDTA
ncbi:hypothetical protein TWF281_005929 [Arthrobotrys megalospora]